MTRAIMAALLCAGLGTATGAIADPSGKIPIQRDLDKWDHVEQRTERTGSLPPWGTGPSNPAPGVPGYGGGPGVVGDSVNSYSPLPPGAPGNEIP